MMPSNDFPGGNLIYCHGEKMEKKGLVVGGGVGTSAFHAGVPKPWEREERPNNGEERFFSTLWVASSLLLSF